jgi:hypothetical protein
VDPITILEILAGLTLAFVVVMEVTIVTVSWRGLKAAQDLQARLGPVLQVLSTLTPAQIEQGALRLREWFERGEMREADLTREGL